MQALFHPECLEHRGSPSVACIRKAAVAASVFLGWQPSRGPFWRSPCFFWSHASLAKESDPSEFLCPHQSQGHVGVPYLVGLSWTNRTREQLFTNPNSPLGLQAPYLPLWLSTRSLDQFQVPAVDTADLFLPTCLLPLPKIHVPLPRL